MVRHRIHNDGYEFWQYSHGEVHQDDDIPAPHFVRRTGAFSNCEVCGYDLTKNFERKEWTPVKLVIEPTIIVSSVITLFCIPFIIYAISEGFVIPTILVVVCTIFITFIFLLISNALRARS